MCERYESQTSFNLDVLEIIYDMQENDTRFLLGRKTGASEATGESSYSSEGEH